MDNGDNNERKNLLSRRSVLVTSSTGALSSLLSSPTFAATTTPYTGPIFKGVGIVRGQSDGPPQSYESQMLLQRYKSTRSADYIKIIYAFPYFLKENRTDPGRLYIFVSADSSARCEGGRFGVVGTRFYAKVTSYGKTPSSVGSIIANYYYYRLPWVYFTAVFISSDKLSVTFTDSRRNPIGSTRNWKLLSARGTALHTR